MPLRPKLKLFDTLKIDGKDSIITPVYRINAYKFYEDFNKNNGHLYFDDFLKIGEDSILKLYFIKESIMKSYPWESICKYKLYSKKTSVTKRQLNNVKCVVYTENK